MSENPGSQIIKPGALIRQARRQQQLSLEDLAERTRLSLEILSAMENDDFAALGQLVYARGYYRKTATVLGLRPASVMSSFEAATGTESPAPPVSQRPSIPYREGRGALAVILMLLLFGGAAGGLLWWLWRSGQLPGLS